MFSGKQEKPATRLEYEMKQRNQRILQDFIIQADVPKWYRGLSAFQIEAVNKLHFAIRDDLEQGTTHRVTALLNRIGLRPTIRKENVRFVMFLSGGNDLALLWFIKELFYSTDGPEYSVNEQLILSSVARLDMLFTLRGLDRILPPEQPSKYEIRCAELAKRKREAKKLHQRRRSVAAETNTVSSMRVKYKMPYFDDLVRPRLHEHALTAYPPPHRPQFEFNKVLRDSHFIIPNAQNRWFADYRINAGKKTGMQMLTEKMSELFKASNTPRRAILELSAIFDENMYRQATQSLHDVISSERDMEVQLCKHHQALVHMERMLEHELRVRARDECLKYFDAQTPKRMERLERIRQQIDKDVNAYLIKFRRLAGRTRSHMQLWSQDDIRECDCEKKPIRAESRLCGGAQTQSDTSIYQRYRSYETCLRNQLLPLCIKSEENIGRRSSDLTSNESEYLIGNCILLGEQGEGKCCKGCRAEGTTPQADQKFKREHVSKTQRVREILHQTPCDCGYAYMKKYDYGHSEQTQQSQHASATYFKSPEEHKPYVFDYRRVYDLKEKETSRLDVQREYLKIINSDLNLSKCDPNAPQNLDEAIKRYTKRAFAEGLAAQVSDTEDEEHLRKRYPYLDDVRKYYDPDDAALMQRMLKNALDYLAKDKHYVLASMPDAHKLPSLLAWIESRFGKVYTRSQLAKINDLSVPTIRALKAMTVDVAVPSHKLIGNAIMVDYNCRDYLRRKSEMVRNEYYERLNNSIMDQSRTFYVAIKPNLTDNVRDTFFAYMPSRIADIQHFRLWQAHEHMPAKDEFFKRKCRAMLMPIRG